MMLWDEYSKLPETTLFINDRCQIKVSPGPDTVLKELNNGDFKHTEGVTRLAIICWLQERRLVRLERFLEQHFPVTFPLEVTP